MWWVDLWGKCEKKCESNACCNKQILKLQLNFTEQQSLVQETIEAAGHLCLFLPKFHCELNPIENFWGMVKKYLCYHCDYSFDGFKANLPKALESVPIQMIWWWENHFFHWVEAYANVKAYTSRQFTSHRHPSEQVAVAFYWTTDPIVPYVWQWPNWPMLKFLSSSILKQLIIPLVDIFFT